MPCHTLVCQHSKLAAMSILPLWLLALTLLARHVQSMLLCITFECFTAGWVPPFLAGDVGHCAPEAAAAAAPQDFAGELAYLRRQASPLADLLVRLAMLLVHQQPSRAVHRIGSCQSLHLAAAGQLKESHHVQHAWPAFGAVKCWQSFNCTWCPCSWHPRAISSRCCSAWAVTASRPALSGCGSCPPSAQLCGF